MCSSVTVAGSPSSRSIFDVDAKRRRHGELTQEAAEPELWDDPDRAQEVMAELSALADDLAVHDEFVRHLDDLEALNSLAQEEADEHTEAEVSQGLASLEQSLSRLETRVLLPGYYDRRDAVISVQAGAGGTDSQDWADMLWRMLVRWTERRGFSLDLHDYQEGDEAGIRSATATVRGDRAYGLLYGEAGVHRLVRISPFDAQKRRHTSFASVDVVPVLEAVDDDVEVADQDLRVDVYRSSGPGGQSVNTTDSAVRLTHYPSGIVVACQNERSQQQNRAVAMRLLKIRLAERERQRRDAELAELRGNQPDVAWGHQIRSYTLHPFQLVKDHRTGEEEGNVDAVLDGDLDDLITAHLRWKARQPDG
jgi:peptide chain release factor 2